MAKLILEKAKLFRRLMKTFQAVEKHEQRRRYVVILTMECVKEVKNYTKHAATSISLMRGESENVYKKQILH